MSDGFIILFVYLSIPPGVPWVKVAAKEAILAVDARWFCNVRMWHGTHLPTLCRSVPLDLQA